MGEAWDSLELSLNLTEYEKKYENPSISSGYRFLPAMEEKGMEGEGNGRLGLISQ